MDIKVLVKINLLFFFVSVLLIAQSPDALANDTPLDRLSFRNQPITDILMVLADIGEVSIIPDETVSGSASYHFSTMNFDTALRVFLDTYKLYGIRRDGLIYVSRIDARWNEEAGTVSLHGEDVELRLLLRALSRAMGKTVLFDALPNERLTIHIDDLSPAAALEVLTARLSEHELETKEDYFYIRRIATGEPASRRGQLLSRNNEGLYSLDLERVRFRDLLKDLFSAEGEEYSLLMRGDAVLEELRFEDKEFSELLRLVLEQANGDYQVSGGIYYIFEIQRRDVLKKLKTTVSLPLEHLPAQSVSALLPPDLAAANLMRADTESNTIILRGSPEEIGPLESFIRSLDRPLQHVNYRRFDLGYADVTDALNLLPPRLSALGPKVLPGTNSFIVPVSDAQAEDFSAYLAALDTPPGHFPVQLKYITAETLIKSPSSGGGEGRDRRHRGSDPGILHGPGEQKRGVPPTAGPCRPSGAPDPLRPAGGPVPGGTGPKLEYQLREQGCQRRRRDHLSRFHRFPAEPELRYCLQLRLSFRCGPEPLLERNAGPALWRTQP